MIREAEWLFGLLPLSQDQIVCDKCGFTEPLHKAIGTKTWHVGNKSVMSATGEQVRRALHLCKDCANRAADDFPGVNFYFVEAW